MKRENPAAKYFTRHARVRDITWACSPPAPSCERAVVIPAYDEEESLPTVLASLARTSPPRAAETIVLVVVNNRCPDAVRPERRAAEHKAREANTAILKWLGSKAGAFPYPLGWIDAASPGKELPGKGGVGMARKLGCDSVAAWQCALPKTAATTRAGRVLMHLDADTIVEPTYLEAADEFLATGMAGGALPFRHLPAHNPAAQAAVDSYELYMHHYVAGLRWAASPYAFHTVGSTMICSIEAYLRCGGMPAKRQAGEDFYFMQRLAKNGGVARLKSTTVHPSSRTSRRVPFGTGPRIADAVDGTAPDFRVHDHRCFVALADLLAGFRQKRPAKHILERLPPPAAEFLEEKKLTETLLNFSRQFRDDTQYIRACSRWFDGLATFRLINLLGATLFPPVPVLQGWRELLDLAGSDRPEPSLDEHAFLDWWCRQNGMGSYSPPHATRAEPPSDGT